LQRKIWYTQPQTSVFLMTAKIALVSVKEWRKEKFVLDASAS